MQQAETTLEHIGQKCNSRTVDRISRNYARFSAELRNQGLCTAVVLPRSHSYSLDKDRYALVSQLAVLQACPAVLSRLLRGNGSSLLAAKVLVISRLLHKTLSQSGHAPPLIDKLRNQLASLRRKLLNRIDRQFSKPGADVMLLIENMTAFSLATSSTPTDVLRHFHHIRLQAISSHLTIRSDTRQQTLQALKLYARTLQDTQAIFPKRLADALSRLKSRPLLQDKDVRCVIEFNLDTHECWIVDDVRNFTPWPRHDELGKMEMDKLVRTWAKQALGSFIDGMKNILSVENELKAVVQLRRDLFEMWLSVSTRLPGIDTSSVLNDLRDVINAQLGDLVRGHAEELGHVSSAISVALADWQPGVTDKIVSLWDSSTTSMDMSNGAAQFKKAVLDRSHGRNKAITRVVATYDSWFRMIDETRIVIKDMKDARWDDDLTNDVDDEFGLDSKQALLSEDDPRNLEEILRDALTSASKAMQESIGSVIAALDTNTHDQTTSKTLFLLRIIREIGQRHSTLNSNRTDPHQLFPPALIQPLHARLATSIAIPSYSAYERSLARLARSRGAVARALWEGNPALPVQPSPGTFRFLHALVKDMAACGGDVWAPGAVRELKEAVGTRMNDELLHEFLDNLGPAVVDGDGDGGGNQAEQAGNAEGEEAAKEATGEADAVRQEKVTQVLFDVLYLQRALSIAGSGASAAAHPLDEGASKLGDEAVVDDVALERLKKNAAEYWRRTYLLFALLA